MKTLIIIGLMIGTALYAYFVWNYMIVPFESVFKPVSLSTIMWLNSIIFTTSVGIKYYLKH